MYIKFIDLASIPKIINYKITQSIKLLTKNCDFIIGSKIFLLEKQLKKVTSTKYAITCSNGTDALILALIAINLKKNDVVFVPSFTFASTAECIALLGGIPFFIDIDENSFNIDYKSLQKGICLAKKKKFNTKCIIVVDLFGLPCDFDKINMISKIYDIPIIIDAAQSLGGRYKNKKVGSIGLITTTSFFPTKPLGAFGDGGAIFTNNKKIYNVIKSLRNHGTGKNKNKHFKIGMNARMNTIQALVLIEKLKIFKKEIKIRSNIAKFYTNYLKKITKTPIYSNKSTWAQYAIILKNKLIRTKIKNHLKHNLIETNIYYPYPLHKQLAYKKYPKVKKNLEKSEALSKKIINLPIFPYISKQKKNIVVTTITNFLYKNKT